MEGREGGERGEGGEGGREGGRERGRERGREGGREGRKEGRREVHVEREGREWNMAKMEKRRNIVFGCTMIRLGCCIVLLMSVV